MNGKISSKIYATSFPRLNTINVVQDSQIPIDLQLEDYELPTGANIIAYARGKYASKTFTANCTFSGNTITLIPPAGFFVPGQNTMQIEVDGVIIPFSICVVCSERVSGIGDPSTPEAVKPYVLRAENAATQSEAAAARAEEVKDSIPADYSGLSSNVDRLEDNIREMAPNIRKITDKVVCKQYDFEVGTINASDSGRTYLNNTKRIRTKEGVTYHLDAGDRVVVADGYKSHISWQFDEDASRYGFKNSVKGEFTVVVPGEYAFVIAKEVEDTTANVELFSKQLTIFHEGDALKIVSGNTKSIANEALKIKDVQRKFNAMLTDSIVTLDKVGFRINTDGTYTIDAGLNTYAVAVNPNDVLYHNFSRELFCLSDIDGNIVDGYANINAPWTVPSNVYNVVGTCSKDLTPMVTTRQFNPGAGTLPPIVKLRASTALDPEAVRDAIDETTKDQLTEYVNAKNGRIDDDYIECWGDSLTQQAGWTQIVANASGKKLLNFGVGGESSYLIAARQGALQFTVDGVTIPASAAETVEITSGQANKLLITDGINKFYGQPLLQGEGVWANSINPCYIAGVKGTLSFNNDYNAPRYYFQRSEDGNEVVIDRPTAVVTNAVKTYNHGLMIIFMGANDSYGGGPEAWARLVKLMIQTNRAKDKRFLVIVRHNGTAVDMAETEQVAVREFGRNAILLRPYMAQYGLRDAGLSPTDDDEADMENGTCPHSLMRDDIHFNDYGKNVVGNYIVKRMKELNYI